MLSIFTGIDEDGLSAENNGIGGRAERIMTGN